MSIEARIPEAWRHPAFHDMRQRIEMLEEENRQLREALKPALVFPPSWSLTNRQMELLAVVYAIKATVRWGQVRTSLFGISDDLSPKLVEIHLMKTRRKLRPHGITIETVKGVGLYLTPESRTIIDMALAAMASRRAG